MPGGTPEAYKFLQPIVEKVSAQTEDGPCVTYVGPGGSGNFVKMVHNGIEYGDMQLIAETYDILKHVGGLTNKEISDVFTVRSLGSGSGPWCCAASRTVVLLLLVPSTVKGDAADAGLRCTSSVALYDAKFCYGCSNSLELQPPRYFSNAEEGLTV